MAAKWEREGEDEMKGVALGALGLFLLLGSAWDWRCREIPTWLFAVGALAGVACRAAQGGLPLWDCVGGMALGACLLVIGRAFRGQVGDGDGLTFIVTGIFLGFWGNLSLLLDSLFLAVLFSLALLLLRKATRRTALPFLPFVLAGYLAGALT